MAEHNGFLPTKILEDYASPSWLIVELDYYVCMYMYPYIFDMYYDTYVQVI